MQAFNYDLYKAFFICEIDDDFKQFKKVNLKSSYNLYISEDTEWYSHKNETFEILLMGYCLDIRDSKMSVDNIIKMLVIKESLDEIYNEIDYLNGRYTLVISTKDGCHISSDAISLKPIFYSEKYKLISSHEFIIKKLIGMTDNKLELNEHHKRGFLDLTSHEEIYKLSCNNEIIIPKFEQRRLFPIRNRKEQPFEKAVDELLPYFDNMIDWIDNNPRDAVFSLTGGVDSRSSLAVLKPIINKVKSFTYLRPKKDLKNKAVKTIYTNDEKIVKSMADNLNLDHEFFYFEGKKEDEQYYDYINNVVSSNHSYPLSKYLNENPDFHNTLHIKSTVQALAKTTYPLDLYKPNNFSSMVNGTLHWGSYKIRNSKKVDINAVYEKFLERIKLDLDQLHGFNILDIMYVEIRMGHFQSIITQETDNTLEVFNFVNTRKFFELLFSVPLLDRYERKTHKAIIQHYWPVLNQFGINTEEPFIKSTDVEATVDEFNNEVINGVELIKTNNIYLTKSKGIIQVKPRETPLLVEEPYYINVVNNSVTERKLTINSTYSNENGRENIYISLNDKEYDILDLNKPVQFILKKNEKCVLKYKFSNDKKSSSWLTAAKIILKISK